MQRIYVWLFFLFFFGISHCSLGQDYVDLFRFQYSTTPQNKFVPDSLKNLTAGSLNELGVDLTLPIKLSDKFVIITGYSYDYLNTNTYPYNPVKNPAFYMHALKLGLSWQHNNKWSGQYLIIPKSTGRLDNLNDKNTQIAALALLKKKKNNNLLYRYGLYYNTEIFGNFFVPLLGIWYRSPSKKFELNFTLPVWADLNYTWKSWFTTGFNFQSFVRTFDRPNQITYLPVPASSSHEYLVKASNEIYLYTQFNIKKSVLIQTKIGHSIGRKFKHYNRDDNVAWGFSAFRFGDNRLQKNPNIRDGLIFQVRLIYRFWINEENEKTALLK